MTVVIDLSRGATHQQVTGIVDALTASCQQQFSDEVLAKTGKRPSRERIAKLFDGRCLIDAESEVA